MTHQRNSLKTFIPFLAFVILLVSLPLAHTGDWVVVKRVVDGDTLLGSGKVHIL